MTYLAMWDREFQGIFLQFQMEDKNEMHKSYEFIRLTLVGKVFSLYNHHPCCAGHKYGLVMLGLHFYWFYH